MKHVIDIFITIILTITFPLWIVPVVIIIIRLDMEDEIRCLER